MSPEEMEFAQWEPAVRYWACRMHVNDEDIIQEARISLLMAIRSYDPKVGKKSTHYHGAIKNRIKEELRKLGRRQARYITYPFYREATDDRDDGEIYLEISEPPNERVLLHDLIERLPERERRIVRMYAGGLTEKEIGAAENVSESRISQLIAQARRRVKNMI